MFSDKKFKWSLKVIAVLVAGVFYFQQIAWSSGLADPVGTNTDPSSTMSPSDLESSQSAAQSLVDTQNAIEDFVPDSGPLYSPHNMEYDTLRENATGWKYYYLDGVLKEKTFTDGRSYVYTEHYPDGKLKTTEFYAPGGDLLWSATDHYDSSGNLSGRTLAYSGGRVHEKNALNQDVRITNADGSYTEYTWNSIGKKSSELRYDELGSFLLRKDYHYDQAGRVLENVTYTYNDGTSYYYDDGQSLIKKTLPSGDYYVYEDGEALGQAVTVKFFSSGNTLQWTRTRNFDEAGALSGTTISYSDGTIYQQNALNQDVKLTYNTGDYILYERYPDGKNYLNTYYNADDSVNYRYEYLYDSTGSRSGSVKTLSTGQEQYYDPQGLLTKIVEGGHQEERGYVFSGGEVLYTLTYSNGKIKDVIEGFYTGTELSSNTLESTLANSLSITYDSGISVSYADGVINSISDEGGFVNFYSEGNLTRQNSAKGDLYDFSENYLKRIATVRGNVYNFSKLTDAAGTAVFLTDAVIGGAVCEFSMSNLSAFYYGGTRIDIIDLVIKNSLSVDRVVIDRGEGEEVLAEEDPLYKEITNILNEIHQDIPNIRFEYSLNQQIKTIRTTDYSDISFQDGLISKTVSAEGDEVLYEYIKEGEEVTGLKMTESGAVRTFDQSGNLVSLEVQDENGQTTLNFTGEELTNVTSSGEVIDGITFDSSGGIDSARIIKAEGEEYFFSGGSLSKFISEDNAEYTVDQAGSITSCRKLDTGEVFIITEEVDPLDGLVRKVFTSEATSTRYIFKEEALITIADASGLTINYLYDEAARTKEVHISFGGVRNSTYTYEYTAEGTIITDDVGTRRLFDKDTNKPVKLETPYGDTYDYVYDVDVNGSPITIVNYTQKDKGGGLVIQYFKGEIQRIDKPDGSWIDNIEFDQATQKLKRFSVHTADGKHHNIIIEGKFIQFEMEDSTRLIFYENTLVAFAGSQGIVPLYDENVEELEGLIYSRSRSTSPAESPAEVDVAASNWRHQTYQDSQAISFVERDYVNDQWQVMLELETGSVESSKGEMYLDLRYDIPSLEWQSPIDMRGKEISFMFKLDENFEYDPGSLCDIQVFAKDENWNTQYGTRVEMAKTSDWIKVSLIPTAENINFGYTEPGFDPSSIVMIGLRISEPEASPIGRSHFGKVYIKHDILPDLFSNVNTSGSPLDDLYSELGIVRDLDRLQGETEVTDSETVLESFSIALAEGPSNIFQESMLKQVSWNVEAENANIKGINSVYRDVDSGEFILDVDLSSASTSNTEGEIYMDLRKDVPGLNWSEPVNLVGRPIRMLINIPEGLVGSAANPNGARIFVEDENMNMQYGTWINLKEGSKWYQLELTPTFGEISMGHTYEGFDPSKITRIGINIATQETSGTNFQGEVRLKFLDGEIDPASSAPVSMPLWMDLRNVQEYLLDDNDNYINVPNLSYISQDHYSYIFNRGSGEEPAINISALEASSTNWRTESSKISAPRWNSSGESLLVDVADLVHNSGGIFYLDVRYPNHVPGMDWPQGSSLDLSRYQFTYYIKASSNFPADEDLSFAFSGFVKDRAWRIEYGDTKVVTNDGEWHKVTFTPVPYAFNSGPQYYTDFDPAAINMFGLNLKNISGMPCSGTFEIKYEINSLDLGVNGPGSSQYLSGSPVWVNQREMGEYLKASGISLYADYSLMEDIKALAEEIPTHSLPTDFAAMIIYDENEKVSSISKPDKTTTYFDDNGRIDHISFEDASVFVDYEYDEEGNLSGAIMPSAREKLTSTLDEAIFELEKNAADTLLLLAEQKALLTENFMEDVNAQRRQFASQRASLEAQRYIEIKRRFLWIVWTERVERPGINEAIAQVNQQEAAFNRQVAEELAKLDAEIAARRDEIIQQKNLVLESYVWQGEKMLLAVLHEEAIPIIFYYYRKILGRDATQAEIEAIFDRIDENNGFAGFLESDIVDEKSLSLALKSDALHPVFLVFSDEVKAFIEGYSEEEVVPEDTVKLIARDLDEAVLTYDLYDQLVTYYGSVESLDALLSDKTKAYRDSLTFLGKATADLTDVEKDDVEWLNRYILQDVFPSLKSKDRSSATFSALALKDELTLSEEHLNSEGFKQGVIDYLRVFLDDYLNNPASRSGYLSSLGLSQEEAIDIDQGFLDVLYGWLENQDLHFGRSAFGSLRKLLKDNGVDVPLEELAKEAILIDVLTGTTGPLTDESLELSMYAMSKVANLHGVMSQAARLDYADIMGADKPFITLINGHHYVTVLSATDTEVTYYDESQGQWGSEITITREEFEDNWDGNTITTDQTIEAEKLLSEEEAKHIKGAFFFAVMLGALFAGLANAIGGLITIAIGTITAIATAITGLIGNFVVGLVEGIFNVGKILSFGLGKFLGAMGIGGTAGTVAGAASKVAIGFNLPALVHGATTTLLKVGVSYGVSVGLEAIGVDPIVSGLLSSIVTGGVDGFLSPGGGLQLAFRKAIEYGSFTGMSLLGQHFDVDPVITNLLAMSTSVFAGAGLNPEVSFKEALESVTKNVVGELAYYGVQLAGTAMGIDPNISYLAGIGIRSSLQAGLGTFGLGGGSPGEWFDATLDGLIGGITSIGLQWVYGELGIPPILGAITSNMVISSIEAILNQKNIFFTISENTSEALMNTFTLGGNSEDPWRQAAYIANLMDFVDIIKEDGILAAFETYLAAMFHQSTISSITENGGIFDMITGRAEIIFDSKTNRNKKRFWTTYAKEGYVDIDLETGLLLEKCETVNGVKITTIQRYSLDASGEYELDENGEVKTSGTRVVEEYSDGTKFTKDFDEKGNHIKTEGYDLEGKLVYKKMPLDGASHIEYDENGVLYNGIEYDATTGKIYQIKNGEVSAISEQKNVVVKNSQYEYCIYGAVVQIETKEERRFVVMAGEEYNGYMYNDETGETVPAKFTVNSFGNIIADVNGEQIDIGSMSTYIGYAQPVKVDLANGATIPTDGFKIIDLRKIAMQDSGISDPLHDFIESIETVTAEIQRQMLPQQNTIGLMSTGSIETEVDISALHIPNNPGLDKVNSKMTQGIVTDLDWDAAVDRDKTFVNAIVDKSLGGTIKSDTTTIHHQTNMDTKEVVFGRESSALYVGDKPVDALLTDAGFYEVSKEVQIGDLKYKLSAKVYMGGEGEKTFTRAKTTVIRSDNTFAITEIDLTTIPNAENPEVMPETYAQIATHATLNNEGIPTILGEEILKIYEEACTLAGGPQS